MKNFNSETLTSDDIMAWIHENKNGSETHADCCVDGAKAIGLRYSPENGGHIYVCISGEGWMNIPWAVLMWLENPETVF